MSKMPISRVERLLFVEGKDDVHVIGKLLEKHNLSELRDAKDKSIDPLKINLSYDTESPLPLDIKPSNSDENTSEGVARQVLRAFSARVENLNPCLVAVGMVLDNDKGANRVESVRNEIIRLTERMVSQYQWRIEGDFSVDIANGFIVEPANEFTPRIGCWLMPDNRNEGMLEDFLAEIIPEDRGALRDFASHTARQAKENHHAPYRDCHASKAAMHTYLAWQNEPGKPFGLAFEQGCFDANHDLALNFLNWLKRLFRPRGEPQEPLP